MSVRQHTISRVLITGGAGFLGSHLCEKLLQKGLFVICIDDFSSGCLSNLRRIQDHPKFEMITHDVCIPFDVQVDAIYHLACPASPQSYQQDPIKTLKTNFLGSLHALECAQKNKARILLSSTSEVYGDPVCSPQKESYFGNVNPIGPRACYDEGKRSAEALFSDFHRKYKLPIKIVRIFNTYGPHMLPDDGRVISNFIIQALENTPLTIYGDGSQTRSFCYVDDLIEGLITFMECDQNLKGPLNLGNPHEMRIDTLATTIIELLNSKSTIQFLPALQDDPQKRRPSIELAEKWINFSPKVSLEEGLKKTIDYFAGAIV